MSLFLYVSCFVLFVGGLFGFCGGLGGCGCFRSFMCRLTLHTPQIKESSLMFFNGGLGVRGCVGWVLLRFLLLCV